MACVPAAEDAAPTTGILGAMGLEIQILIKALENPEPSTIEKVPFVRGRLNGRRVVITRMGIGKVNSAVTATLLLEHFKPAEVLVTGIAGAINPELFPGDVVIAAKTAQHDYGDLTAEGFKREGTRSLITWERNPLFYAAEPRLIALGEAAALRVKLQPIKTAAAERAPRIVKGVVATGDVFVADAAKKAELRQALGADAVEMEGAAVAQVCHQQGVPCLVIRSMSDNADANAAKDAREFGRIAAENSAKLVMEIVALLAEKPKQ